MFDSAGSVKAVLAVLAVILIPVVYFVRLHPLRHVPGPTLAKTSDLFLNVICYLGIEGRVLRYCHQKYGKVIRVAPNSVSVSDAEAIRDIYIAGGGFPKDYRYRNFDLGPVVSIFSSIDNAYRDVRAKAVAPLFAPAQLRAESGPDGVIGSCIAEFVTQLREFKDARVKTDLLDLCARLSIDVVTVYLLGQRYGGLHENTHLDFAARQSEEAKLSANPFIHAIVAFSRFSLLPNRLFKIVYAVSQRLSASDHVAVSFMKLDAFINEVMKRTRAVGMSEPEKLKARYYQERLVAAGVSPDESAAQSKAIVFAGADSTAVMLTTTLFHLVQNGSARRRLRAEIRSNRRDGHTLEGLPFLRACVKEGLRLGMANPTRLTRVVPAGSGLQVGKGEDAIALPPGTIVGCAAYDLHHDPEVFPHPFSFCPERWLDDGTDGGLRRPGMDKSMMPFGHGLRACIGKNLAMHQLHETVLAVMDSDILEGATTCQDKIEMYEWFNGDIKGYVVDIYWR
ncbi:Pisatin demethylase [Diplogelasinospora grovesii]|uniref:Pisatin demethylase n=1 Tax=Diplogelasinospora grovesii TaxID=303347 RepID=A0AAN6S4J6_9PEZI|nr:Pisatin demethylase [Diplogelasinospora grovesii]